MYAVFDIGKTNKKFFVFDKNWSVVYEKSVQFEEVSDEDGFPSDNLSNLKQWVRETFEEALIHPHLNITHVNVSAYGASLVHIDREGKTVTPLYNYLKPYPNDLKAKFFENYGPQPVFSASTASPYLGMLNSGLQIYRLKYLQPDLFAQIQFSLHLPQYLSFLLGGKAVNEITGTGCHTGLWDFSKNQLHEWVDKEAIHRVLPPIFPSDQSQIINFSGKKIQLGPGIHDSSAALVPYLLKIKNPFLLLSTGTWSIAMNPFNRQPLTEAELDRDVLSYLTFEGNPVKSARLFLGNEHDYQLERIATYFDTRVDFAKELPWNEKIFREVQAGRYAQSFQPATMAGTGPEPGLKNGAWDLSLFPSKENAYYQLLWELAGLQAQSIQLADGIFPPQEIYIDGGFAKNTLFTRMIVRIFPTRKVFVAEMSQGSALGAALVLHKEKQNLHLPLTFREVEK